MKIVQCMLMYLHIADGSVVSVESGSQADIDLTSSFSLCYRLHKLNLESKYRAHREIIWFSLCDSFVEFKLDCCLFVSIYLVYMTAQVRKGKLQRKYDFFKKSGLSSTYFFP
jgi:hypothetical protein